MIEKFKSRISRVCSEYSLKPIGKSELIVENGIPSAMKTKLFRIL
ncbi:MAG: hypothetical protein QXN39_01440 [Archaeoglobaceae archaeon]